MPELHWNGKEAVMNHHHTVPIRALMVDEGESFAHDEAKAKGWEPSLDDNLIITGDNLEALKALLPKYAGKVDVIYIDPPYNTGNEKWVYNDKVNSPQIKAWYKKVVGGEEDDLQRHDKWLCMMYPRLQLLKELLSTGGVIYISIGVDEVATLIQTMDDIFGIENKVDIVPRIAKTTSDKGTHFAPSVDYILCYTNNKSDLDRFKVAIDDKGFNKIETEGERKGEKYKGTGFYQASLDPLRGCSNQRYWVKCPDGSYVIPPGKVFPDVIEDGEKTPPKSSDDKVWRWADSSYLKQKDSCFKQKNRLLYFIESDRSPLLNEKQQPSKWNVYVKSYLSDRQEKGKLPRNFVLEQINSDDIIESCQNTQGTKDLQELDLQIFDYAKPVNLVKHLLSILPHADEMLVLDSFAGSGTTGQAVMTLNADDGGNRKFILVQMDEETTDTAKQHGYNTVDAITRERIRRVIKGVPTAKSQDLQKGLGGSFTSVTLGNKLHLDTLATATDEQLPSYEQLAAYVFYHTTLQALPKQATTSRNGFIGETDTHKVYLLYKPSQAALTTSECAFTLSIAENIQNEIATTGKEAIVYAPLSFVDAKTLRDRKWLIRYCNLPYELLQVDPIKAAPEYD